MVEQGLVRDPRVLEALRAVPRDAFLPMDHRVDAYEDRPMPIGHGQTMSAPHMVAIMADHLLLEPGQRVLEVGTGSGYHAAITSHLIRPGGRLTSIEFYAALADVARANLARVGVKDVRVIHADGSLGWPEEAPFDRIYLTCAARAFPPPLLKQLAPDGYIMGPIGGEPARLLRAHKAEDTWIEEDLGAVAFVPLRGEYGTR